MSINLNASAFLNQTQNDYAKKLVAENYMQMYQYAAEDFPTHPDLLRFITELTTWMASVDQRLAVQMGLISTHTHSIPPHTHGVISHSVTTPMPLATLPPASGSSIKWSPVNYPIFLNTSGVLPNLIGNRIMVSVASEGSILPTIRRMQPIPITMIPSLSPALQDALKPSIGI